MPAPPPPRAVRIAHDPSLASVSATAFDIASLHYIPPPTVPQTIFESKDL